jgi:hypothetical protein
MSPSGSYFVFIANASQSISVYVGSEAFRQGVY